MHINKFKKLRLAGLGAIICLHGCGGSSGAPVSTPTTPTTSTTPENISKTVTNGNLVFELIFMGKLSLQNNNEKSWNIELQQPYINAANKWLSALTAVDGKALHTIKIKIFVKALDGGNGQAGPDSEEKVGDFLIPTSGELTIANHTYAEGFDPIEFYANILHEMGHIIGIGSYTETYMKQDAAYKGNVFRVDDSVAVKTYNEIYGTFFDFVPMSDDGGHLYDYVLQEDKKRVLDNGMAIPPLTKEFMANGTIFGAVTLAVLDDIGYQVSYSGTDPYIP
jgi:hypothetical protein